MPTGLLVTSKLFDAPPPRAREEIDRILAPLDRRTRRQATRIGGFFIVITGLVWILLMATPTPVNPDNPYEAVFIATGLFVMVGIAPFLAIRFVMLRDVRTAKRVLEEGEAHEARVTSHRQFPYGGLHILDLAWGSDRAKTVGTFELIDYDQPLEIGQRFEVFALDVERRAVALLGENGLVVGRIP